MLASCQVAHPLGEETSGQRRHDEEGRDEQGADHRERRRGGEGDQAEQGDVEQPARRPAAPALRVEAGGEPALPEQQRGDNGRHRRDGGEGDVAVVDQQQAAEEQRLDVRAGAEDVAGEDHPGGEAADEDDRHGAVAPPLVAASEQRGAGGEDDRGAESAQRRREAQPVSQDQPGEGRGADRVREEGEAAQDDPGAEQAGGHGQDQDLDQPALDEGQLEGLEHGAD